MAGNRGSRRHLFPAFSPLAAPVRLITHLFDFWLMFLLWFFSFFPCCRFGKRYPLKKTPHKLCLFVLSYTIIRKIICRLRKNTISIKGCLYFNNFRHLNLLSNPNIHFSFLFLYKKVFLFPMVLNVAHCIVNFLLAQLVNYSCL